MAEHVGLTNILHAYAACNDPDCEIHHPEVIEDHNERRTAKAYMAVGVYEVTELVMAALRSGNDAWTALDMAIAESIDNHNLKEFVIEEDKA